MEMMLVILGMGFFLVVLLVIWASHRAKSEGPPTRRTRPARETRCNQAGGSYTNPYGHHFSQQEMEDLQAQSVGADEVGPNYDRDGVPFGGMNGESEDWDF